MHRAYPLAFVAALICSWMAQAQAQAAEPAKRATENVILYMTDGLRWQEVFNGAEEALMTEDAGGVKNVAELKAKFWRDTPAERRAALMPFFWSVLAKQGQVFGNQAKGSMAKVTNGMHFSYPGYNETLCGFADPRIDSNDKKPNHNVTVFEWLHRKPAYAGRVAAFGVWDVFPYIFNDRRCGFLVNAARDPLQISDVTPRIALLNELKAQDTRYWAAEPFDSLTIFTALEYMKLKKPKLMFLSINETDSWGHAGRYDLYLDAARRADDCLRMLWETAQSLPEYKGQTSLIFVPDHGRGDAPVEWKSHGEKIARSEYIWLGVMGPDTPPLGERENAQPVTQSQVAATFAALVGEDYCAAVPEAAKPIGDVLGATQSASR
ncbi:MAG: alkaline phosphatase family protein [Pirellulales bacterium]